MKNNIILFAFFFLSPPCVCVCITNEFMWMCLFFYFFFIFPLCSFGYFLCCSDNKAYQWYHSFDLFNHSVHNKSYFISSRKERKKTKYLIGLSEGSEAHCKNLLNSQFDSIIMQCVGNASMTFELCLSNKLWRCSFSQDLIREAFFSHSHFQMITNYAEKGHKSVDSCPSMNKTKCFIFS